ncbi:MAG: alkane 1-monooxygenase [Vicinamibacterales bacterium]
MFRECSRSLAPFFYYTPLAVTWYSWYLFTTHGWGNAYVWANLIYVVGVVSLADALLGPTEDGIYEPLTGPSIRARDWLYKAILVSAVPLFALMVWWSCRVYASEDFTPVETVAWVLSTGLLTTLLGHDAAHELIHKTNRTLQTLGGILFGLALYGGAKVSHIRSHHVLVGTRQDPTTARLGQSLYAFLPGALGVNLWGAWQVQRRVLTPRGISLLSLKNELMIWGLISVATLGCVFGLFGTATLAFFLAQSFVGASLLEMCNYAGHYGLVRRRLPDGRYEPVSLRHAWNCDYVLNNLISLNVQRHPDHHKHGPRDYQLLRHFDQSPQLPQGYSALVFIVFIPALWRRYMDPLVARANQVEDVT